MLESLHVVLIVVLLQVFIQNNKMMSLSNHMAYQKGEEVVYIYIYYIYVYIVFDCGVVVLAKMHGLARPIFSQQGIRLPSLYTAKD